MRVIGLDYGRARIGIAKTDPLGLVVEPLCALATAKSAVETIAALLKALAPYAPIDAFVLGLPLLLNGSEGEMAREVRAFGTLLHSLSKIPVAYWDERLTSEQVEKALQGRLSRKRRAQVEDAMAAALILEGFVQSQ